MKMKIAFISISLFAILILISIQTFLITRIYVLESEKFDFRYREMVNEAMDKLMVETNSNGLTKSFFILDRVSEKYLKYLESKKEIDTTSFRKIVTDNFYEGIKKYQDIENGIIRYLKKRKMKEPFQSYFQIKELNLIYNEGIFSIIKNGTDADQENLNNQSIPVSALLVNHYKFEGNNFGIVMDYFVDFGHKKQEVLNQVYKSVYLTGISLFIVIAVFLLTLQNLLKERRLSQMKTDFINNMTHELKTPLSTISVASKTLENEQIYSNSQKVLETAKTISRQNIQLTRQINHLLEVTKWEKKQFELNKKWVELEPFFKGVIESFKWDCKDKTLIVNEIYSLNDAKAFFDETQITSVIFNLLNNGVKYNLNQPVITFKVWSDNFLHISISDNGIGMSKESTKHIFEKFYRVHTGNIHNVKGLGLGLYYADQIVRAHYGSIDVVSKVDFGSTFNLNIPIDGKNQNTSGRG
jgi:signal transduction histidine kinase